jgi:hypothetical protein
MEEEEEEEGEFKDFTDGNKEEGKQYKNRVVFLRMSKAGKHLYAFDNDGAFAGAIEGSIVMNIAEVRGLISGNLDFIKVSILPKKEEGIDADFVVI